MAAGRGNSFGAGFGLVVAIAFCAKALLLGLLALVVWTTNDAFFLVGSSASVSTLLAPPAVVQVGGVVVAALALLVPARRWRRAGLVVLAAGAVLLAGHRVVVDVFTAEAQDIYLGQAVQTFRFDPDAAPLAWRRSFAGIRLDQAGRPGGLWAFSPGWLGLDLAPADILETVR